ncbi:DUF3866 family protein [Terrabacter sp. 2RAF25]|uniref:DUF3866 family protein n=1 Tax=Terrabacter sp. 2RAF25 TaxID=3232998 RepID=UPI003F9AA43E
MIQWRRGVVVEVRSRWAGAVEYAVRLASGDVVRALGYVELVGALEPGTEVLLNTTALERGLGTGGLAIVVAAPDALPDPVDDVGAVPGHVVKARYTPTQTMVLGVDEQDSEHHALLAEADDLAGLPVVVADLHSALPAVLAGIREADPHLRVAYVMTDGGALPVDFSRTVAGLREAGWLAASVTVGQAFGGDLEAVNVHTGLLAAHHVVGADVVVVAQGPGNLGTGTRWGFSGTSAGEAVNAAATLGGRAVCSLRISQSDPRERHLGVSHHSLTAYGRVSLVPADVPVPLLPGDLGERVLAQARELGTASSGRLRLHEVSCDGLEAALRTSPVTLRTMGRGYDDDRASFLGAAVAGRFAAGLVRRAPNPASEASP